MILAKCSDCEYNIPTPKGLRKEWKKQGIVSSVTYVPYYTSQKPKEYYVELSKERYNTEDKWREIFIEEEVSKLPEFNYEKYLTSKKAWQKRDERKKDKAEHPEKYAPKPNPNIPKCPTCGSTDIKKISVAKRAIHGYAFGLFSKTARSQFECGNCGYKW